MKNLDRIIKNIIRETTGDSSGSRGSYILPMQPGLRPWIKTSLDPYTQSVSKYDSPLLAYDSYDGSMDERLDQIKKIEATAKKITNYIKKHPSSTFSDDDGNVVNPFLTNGGNAKFSERMEPFTEKVPFNEWVELTYKDVILETSNTSVTAGPYTAPIEIGSYNWGKSQLDPFTQEVKTEFNKKSLENNLKKNIKRIVGVWEKDKNGSYNRDIDYPNTVNEDLAVWFGKKKKPKGSSQPKGPWVNICSKVDGKHPPCGRQDTSKGSYPKCRAVGVAGKMSDSQKQSACQQKRTAEKKDTQTGKGQKPVMTSYKPKNESMKKTIRLTENDLIRIIKKVITEQTAPKGKVLNLFCQSKNNSFRESGLTLDSEEDMYGGLNGGGLKRIFLTPSPTIPRESYEPSTVILDVVPAAKMNKDFLEKSKMANPNQKIYLISHRTNITHFCSIDAGTDKEWSDYLNKL